MYTIQYFEICNARAIYRSVDHPYMARFTKYTNITEVSAVPPNFPLYACCITPYAVLRDRVGRKEQMPGLICCFHLQNILVQSINDFSHSVIKMKQEQLDASNFFYAAMQDNVVSLALERDATLAVFQKSGDSTDAKPHPLSKAFIKKKQDELNNDCFYEILQDKITNLLRDRDVQKQRYTSIIHGMASICDTFADILPIKKISTNQTTSEDAETGFVFTGSKKTLRAVMNLPWLS